MGRRPKEAPQYADLIDQMTHDYREGLSRTALSKKYGVSMPTVKGWLLRAGEPLRDGREQQRSQDASLRLDIDEDKLRILYLDELWAAYRIANHLGVSEDAIRTRISRLGLERTEEQERKASKVKGQRIAASSRAREASVREKYSQTCQEKYGVDNSFQTIPSPVPEWARKIISDPAKLLAYIKSLPEDQRTISCVSALMGCSYDWIAQHTRGEEFEGVVRRGVSIDEESLRNFVNSLGVESIKRDRSVLKPQELDIYCPDQKVALEYNGIYWHSAQFKDRKFHIGKTLGCRKQGIRLIHVWEHLWLDPKKRPIYENMIRHALSLTENRVGARKTRVEKRRAIEMKPFFEENNIQGYRNASDAYVLVHKETGEDLMCYTTGHAYFGKGRYDLEIARGACKLGWSVSGGATKLWKAIIEDNIETNSIVYYVDLNHYDGSSVSVLPGSRLIQEQPGFWNWFVKEKKMKNRDPSRHAEIKAGYEDGSIWQVHNAGSSVYVWERDTVGVSPT